MVNLERERDKKSKKDTKRRQTRWKGVVLPFVTSSPTVIPEKEGRRALSSGYDRFMIPVRRPWSPSESSREEPSQEDILVIIRKDSYLASLPSLPSLSGSVEV